MARQNKGWKVLTVFILIAVLSSLDDSEATSGSVVSAFTSKGSDHPEAQNASQSKIQDPLEDTVRIDPIKHFKKYRGGYDIRNKHYWSSTAFTGVYGYAIALIWLISGVVYGGFSLYFMRRANKELEEKCYIKNVILATFLAILVIVATGLVYGGSARHLSRSRTILRIIISTEDDATQAIRDTTRTMDMISQNLASGYVVGGYKNVSRFLKTESNNLNSKADSIERKSQKIRKSIGKGLSIVFIVTLVAVSLNLTLVLLLSVLGIIRYQRTTTVLIIMISMCWILTGLCYSLFGTYFFLENFSKDTCTALTDFQQNPKNSSLSSILPCNSLASAGSILHRVSINIHDLVDKANANITTLKKTTYPDLVYVCNPFSGPPNYVFQPENCPVNSIKIGEIPQALKVFTCPESYDNVSCKQQGFISSNEFYKIQAVTSSIQSFLDAYPVMQSLVDCQLVKDSFALILDRECRPWKGDARMTWIAFLGLSILMTALVVVWATRAHHQDKPSSAQVKSIQDHSTAITINEENVN